MSITLHSHYGDQERIWDSHKIASTGDVVARKQFHQFLKTQVKKKKISIEILSLYPVNNPAAP